MKRKIALIGLTTALVLTAAQGVMAHPMAYNDVYNIVNGNALSSKVISGHISIQKIASNKLLVTEPEGYESGGVFMTSVGKDAAHQCTLTIQDVDFQVPQLIGRSCTGGYNAVMNADYNDVTITVLKAKA